MPLGERASRDAFLGFSRLTVDKKGRHLMAFFEPSPGPGGRGSGDGVFGFSRLTIDKKGRHLIAFWGAITWTAPLGDGGRLELPGASWDPRGRK